MRTESSRRILIRLRAVSLFSCSVEQSARDTQMTTRVTEGARRERHSNYFLLGLPPSLLASRVSRLASRVSRLAARGSRLAARVSRLASRGSRLAASPLNARVREHSPYQIWRKRKTARSLHSDYFWKLLSKVNINLLPFFSSNAFIARWYRQDIKQWAMKHMSIKSLLASIIV